LYVFETIQQNTKCTIHKYKISNIIEFGTGIAEHCH